MPLVTLCSKCGAFTERSPCEKCRPKQKRQPDYYRTREWRDLAREARKHYDRCSIPGCSRTYRLTFHHLIPRKQGGPDVLENLIAMCGKCHSQYESDVKHEKDTEIVRKVNALAKSRGIVIPPVKRPANAPPHFDAPIRNRNRRRSRRR